jgi:signal transduction histidine kinase
VRTDGKVMPVEVLVCPHRAGTSLAIVRQAVPMPAQVAVDDLAAIVHDLKNPLATIALESYMLELRFEQAIDDAMVRAFARIRHNLDFADRLVHDLLDLASSNAGGLELVRRPTELASLLEDVIERSVPSRDRTRVFLEAPPAVVASIDDVRIQRVVANLVQNALKYSPATAGVIVRLEALPGAVRVSVTDAGPGIPVNEQRALFERFRRASTGAGIEGTGLGLYVSRQIIEAHGGVIGVETLRGAGARFYFALPL